MPYYVIGIDPGQAVDPTAVAILEYDHVQHPIYRVRGLHRFPLGTPYTELPAALKPRLSAQPLRGRVKVAIDATGVGAPIVDHLRDQLRGVPLYAITITGGANATGKHKQRHVPKRDLISTASVILEQRRLLVAANMRDTDALTDELLAYRRTISEHGNDTYQAASGSHDDLVLAVSLALWTAQQTPFPPRPYNPSNHQLRDIQLPSTEEMVAAQHRWNWTVDPYR